MIYTDTNTNFFIDWNFPLRQLLGGIIFVLAACLSIFAQQTITVQPDANTIVIEDAPEMEVLSFGKTVIIKKEVKGVFSFGGDVIIEGRVSGDVGTIGGTIIQKENAFIGGAVMAFGGSYKPESRTPLRNPGAETVMYAGYEEELRGLSQNPSQIFSPDITWAFVAQRFLLVLFWFVISFALTTIAPGAVSRAIARVQISWLKVVAVGFSSFLATLLGAMVCLKFLPDYISAVVSLMLFVVLLLSYVFGKTVLQISVGKRLQKRFLPESKQSETVAILTGVVFWTILLSVPYLWILALIVLFSASVGLVLTARSPANAWQKQQ